MTSAITFAGKTIGPDHPPFIVAEMSCNHLGSMERGKEIIRAAKEAGADAVKIQTYTADSITLDGPQDHFQIDHPLWKDMTLHALYEKAQTPFEWAPAFFDYGREIGIPVFSAPFDLKAADYLEDHGNPLYKIASFEAVHIPLIQKCASFGKPMIISTGMADKQEITEALTAAKSAGAKDIMLLHCISAYPTPPEEANLNTIPLLADEFGCMVGLSDHTKSPLIAELAVGLGAVLIEKHLMMDKNDESFDAAFSLTPDEFAILVETCKTQTAERFNRQKQDPAIQAILGHGNFDRKPGEKNSAVFRPSIMAARDLKAGERLTNETMIVRRPSAGLPPKYWDDLQGAVLTCDLRRGDGITWDAVDKNAQSVKAAG